MKFMQKLVAEFIGTAILVIFGCGSAVAANALLATMGLNALAFSTLLISFAFGLVIVAMAYSIGNISGCHINPAVSIAMLISKKMTVKEFFGYIVAQCIGATAGAGVLTFILGGNGALGTNGFGTASALGIDMPVAFVLEVILTFVFVIAILGVTSKVENSSVAGLVIGLTLVLVHILGVPFTGTSVNPARSFGPAIVAGGLALEQVWVFILAPLLGGAIAAFTYMFLTKETNEEVVENEVTTEA